MFRIKKNFYIHVQYGVNTIYLPQSPEALLFTKTVPGTTNKNNVIHTLY
jgi:hypothetical protein